MPHRPGLHALPDEKQKQELRRLRQENPELHQLEKGKDAASDRYRDFLRGRYDLRGAGPLDFSKLFAERAMRVLAPAGRLGYVLPSNGMVVGGWKKLRRALFEHRPASVVQARNTGGWLFEDVHRSYAIALVCRGEPVDESIVSVSPEIDSWERFAALHNEEPVVLNDHTLRGFPTPFIVPLLASHPRAPELFKLILSRPAISSGDGWIRAHNDARWDFRSSGSDNDALIKNDGWCPLQTRHLLHYGYADKPCTKSVDPQVLLAKDRGLERDGGDIRLGPDHPLVVFRHVARNDDTRTMYAAALSEQGVVHAKGYIHAYAHEPGTDTQRLLALLCLLNTHTCDWWVRRFVDRHVSAEAANNVRLPDWDEHQIGRAAAIAGELLRRNGVERLAGGRRIDPGEELAGRDQTDLLAEADLLALRGYGGDDSLAEVVADDFSRRGYPPAYCQALQRRIGSEAP